jgi:phospholipase/carboxylesterase
MMCHGSHDPVVPYHLGDDSRYFLEQAGIDVQWHSYSMQHGVCPDEINDISQWLQKILL